jgi:hypothetical protein
MRKFVLPIMFLSLLFSCTDSKSVADRLNITDKFKYTWNVYEKIEEQGDGSIIYHAVPWGGLFASMKEHNMPVDWSEYQSITFDFAEPTQVATQIMISDELKTIGKAGISSLTCYFDGHNMHAVDEVALQASDSTTLKVRSVRLTPNDAVWKATSIWEGHCVQGDWEGGFVISPDMFKDVIEGDKLELVFHTDKSNPSVTFWLMETIYDGTDQTLEGNNNELNNWGCAMMGSEAKVYRIILTAKDVETLRKKGLFVNGYYNIVTQCNLLRKYHEGLHEE